MTVGQANIVLEGAKSQLKIIRKILEKGPLHRQNFFWIFARDLGSGPQKAVILISNTVPQCLSDTERHTHLHAGLQIRPRVRKRSRSIVDKKNAGKIWKKRRRQCSPDQGLEPWTTRLKVLRSTN